MSRFFIANWNWLSVRKSIIWDVERGARNAKTGMYMKYMRISTTKLRCRLTFRLCRNQKTAQRSYAPIKLILLLIP